MRMRDNDDVTYTLIIIIELTIIDYIIYILYTLSMYKETGQWVLRDPAAACMYIYVTIILYITIYIIIIMYEDAACDEHCTLSYVIVITTPSVMLMIIIKYI